MNTDENTMKQMKSTLLILLPLLAAALFATACHKQTATTKPDDVDYYTCTMHPSVRSQDPDGKCPICSMNLVPVKKKDAAGTNAPKTAPPTSMSGGEKPDEFTVPLARQQQIGVTYATLGKRPFWHTIRGVGVVAYDEQRHWGYVARVDGYVKQLSVFSRGELVEKDAALLTIYSPDLLTTQNEFVDLLKVRDEARDKGNKPVLDSTDRLIEATRQRLRLWNISGEQIAALATTRKARETLTLYSPFRGVVQDLGVAQGRKVMTGDHLVDVADLSVVWVWVDFYQDELPMLKKGLPVVVSSSSYPGEKFNGEISVMDPFMNESLRTGRLRIDVKNDDFKLRPNMYVDAEVTMDMGESVAVPVNAVLPTGKHNLVFVSKGGGRLEPRYIEIGRKYGDFYEANSGLKEGEQVVTSVNFLIDAEAKVQVALTSW